MSKLHSWTKSHTVAGLIFDSLSFLIDDQLPPQALRIKWAVRVDQTERHNTKMNQVIAAQYTSFTNSGLQTILQKGQAIAACYDIPMHRMTGDIDQYFENKGYAEVPIFPTRMISMSIYRLHPPENQQKRAVPPSERLLSS